MSHTPKCSWPGKSGKTYVHHVYPIGTKFLNEPGNSVFCKETSPGQWTPQYIGQTDNLGERLADHEKEACAIARGATHIHAHLNPIRIDRLAEEKDLIQNFNPSCNEQLVA